MIKTIVLFEFESMYLERSRDEKIVKFMTENLAIYLDTMARLLFKEKSEN